MIFIALIILGMIAYLLLGPKDRITYGGPFDASVLNNGIEAYLSSVEADVPNLHDWAYKQVHWASQKGKRTKQVIVYIHGFSATLEETRPMPDLVAKGLGANLYYTRLPGHGVDDDDAMGETVVDDWLETYAETMAIAKALGDEVIIIASSTGASLAASGLKAVAHDTPIKAHVFLGPNFGPNNKASQLALLGGFKTWSPLIVGEYRELEARNERHAKYSTTRYPFVSIMPMMKLIQHVRHQDYTDQTSPLLAIYSDKDLVVNSKATDRFLAGWGGEVSAHHPELTPEDDENYHVLAGDILSPNQTAPMAALIIEWIEGLDN